MSNWIPYYCKMRHHPILLCLFSLFFNTTIASTVSVNVYLKLKPVNLVSHLVSHFNQFLQEKKIFDTYAIEPFLNTHALHVTLYLADYDTSKLPLIIKGVEAIAYNNQSPVIKTDHFIATDSGYVMLTVKSTSALNRLSHITMKNFYSLRDTTASIPQWAAASPPRLDLYKQYGSPNVLKYFNPHFSIMDPINLDKVHQKKLVADLKSLIMQWESNYPTEVESNAYTIAVGIANSQGQIVKELASYPFEAGC